MPPFREPFRQSFDRIANFRDLGGHTTRDGRRVRMGRLFRSGHLGHSSDEDLARLAELGLRSVFDFRTASDIRADGADRLPEGARHVQLSMPDPARGHDIRELIGERDGEHLQRIFGEGRAEAMMVEAAASMVRERSRPYAEFLAHLAEPGSLPALFHCSAGKDRAGWAASVVLLAVGVDEEQVAEQYLLSNREAERIRERLASSDDPQWGELLRPLLEVRREYFAASIEAVEAEWGGFDRYLREGLEVSDAQRERLRDHMLE